MNCSEASQLAHAYADGELDPQNSLGMEAHLKACAACAATVRECRALGAALREADLYYKAPARLHQKVAQTVRSENKSRSPRQWGSLWQWLTVAAAATAALAVMVHPFSPTAREQLADEAVSAHIRSLMASHLTDVVSTDRHTVKPWFAGRVDFTLPVEDYAAQGFALTGGRLDYLHNHPAAALVYRHGNHVINVFAWPDKSSDSSEVRLTSQRGYGIAEKTVGGLHFYAVSDMDGAGLRPLLDLIAH